MVNLNRHIKNRTTGITLIALVITIIVLLILAGVVISTFTGNNGILQKAEEAKNKNTDSEIEEEVGLAYNKAYIDTYMDKGVNITDSVEEELGNGAIASLSEDGKELSVTYKGRVVKIDTATGKILEIKVEEIENKWINNQDGTWTHAETGNKIQIGDKVNYNELSKGEQTYTTDTTKGIGGSVGTQNSVTKKYTINLKTYTTEDLSWRILGVNERGEIELISEDPMSESNKVYLTNEEGYINEDTKIINGVEKKGTLDTMCNTLYGKGKWANSARSLNVDDIDKLAGIKTESDKKSCTSDYGSKWQYRYPTEQEETGIRYMQYKKNTGSWTNIRNNTYQKFRMPGESDFGKISDTNIIAGISPELTYTHYTYSISSKINIIAKDGTHISDLISKGTTKNNINQWLASTSVYCDSIIVNFLLRSIDNGNVNYAHIFNSFGDSNCNCKRVRPVVFLRANVKLSGNSLDGWTIQQ